MTYSLPAPPAHSAAALALHLHDAWNSLAPFSACRCRPPSAPSLSAVQKPFSMSSLPEGKTVPLNARTARKAAAEGRRVGVVALKEGMTCLGATNATSTHSDIARTTASVTGVKATMRKRDARLPPRMPHRAMHILWRKASPSRRIGDVVSEEAARQRREEGLCHSSLLSVNNGHTLCSAWWLSHSWEGGGKHGHGCSLLSGREGGAGGACLSHLPFGHLQQTAPGRRRTSASPSSAARRARMSAHAIPASGRALLAPGPTHCDTPASPIL